MFLSTLGDPSAASRTYPQKGISSSLVRYELQALLGGDDFERQCRVPGQEMTVLRDECLSADPFGICRNKRIGFFETHRFISCTEFKGDEEVLINGGKGIYKSEEPLKFSRRQVRSDFLDNRTAQGHRM